MSNVDKLTRLFSFFTRDFVAGAKNKSVGKVSDNLGDINFLVRNFTPYVSKKDATPENPESPQIIDVVIIDDEKFGKYIAGEAHKFFLASMISLERSRQDQNHNTAWQIVEHYYSTYYAIHYLMRVAGYSVTNIDEKSMRFFKSRSVVPIEKISSGLCILKFTKDCSELIVEKKEKSGGSHKDAWSIWVSIVDELIDKCKTDPAEYSSLEIELLAHRKFISENSGRFNPPDIRAEINYQFKGDAWCFEDVTKARINNISAETDSFTYDLTKSDDRVISLINNNKLIINLAKSFFNYSVKEYSRGICRSLNSQFGTKIRLLEDAK